MSPPRPAPLTAGGPAKARELEAAARDAPPGPARARVLCCGPAATASAGNCLPRPAGDAPQRKPPDPLLARAPQSSAATRALPWSHRSPRGSERPGLGRLRGAAAGQAARAARCGARGRGQSRISGLPLETEPAQPAAASDAASIPSTGRGGGCSLVPKLPPLTSLQDGTMTWQFLQDAPLWTPPTAAPGSTQVTPSWPYSRLPRLSSWPWGRFRSALSPAPLPLSPAPSKELVGGLPGGGDRANTWTQGSPPPGWGRLRALQVSWVPCCDSSAGPAKVSSCSPTQPHPTLPFWRPGPLAAPGGFDSSAGSWWRRVGTPAATTSHRQEGRPSVEALGGAGGRRGSDGGVGVP